MLHCLPPHRLERLYTLLSRIQPPHRRVSVKIWHQLLGKLRSMSPAHPGSHDLFSALQDALGKADRNRVRITRHVWDLALYFTAITDSLSQRPTRLKELVPSEPPAFVGASSDASGAGMGGVWFDHQRGDLPPILWRTPFPPSVTSSLVSSTNPRGAISISDLELAAMLAHTDILAHYTPLAERTV